MIPSNKNYCIYNADVWILGILISHLHFLWLKSFGGKLKNDFSYSTSLVYNTFPIPKLSQRRINEIEAVTLEILDAREEQGGSLAELYGSPLAIKKPKPMNVRLEKIHKKLDEVVERAYKSEGFRSDEQRLDVLLGMYEGVAKTSAKQECG